jgi:tripeptidyl-peptidase I
MINVQNFPTAMNPTINSCMVHFLIGSLICGLCIGKSFGHRNLRDLWHEKTHIFKESIPNLDSRDDLLRIHRMNGDYVHRVVFVTKQRNSEELLQILHDVSDPASIKYGQHVSREEVTEMTANAEAYEAVVRFANTRGASIISKTLNGEYITCDAPISVWERIFNCEFFMFHQSDAEDAIDHIVRAESYSIPRELEVHVESVFNTVQMPYRQSNTRNFKLQGSSTHITPDILKSAYNMGTSVGTASSTQGIYASINQNFSPDDLSAFQLIFGLAQQDVSTVIGGHSSSSVCVNSPLSCAEANLDVQYIMATSTISPTTFWYTDFTSFSSWLVEVADVMNPPLVLSISYGIEESYVTIAEHRAFNIQAIKLGVMGVTIVVASGDNGAVSRFFDQNPCVYAPSFPASSPYVTAVGATMVLNCGTDSYTD